MQFLRQEIFGNDLVAVDSSLRTVLRRAAQLGVFFGHLALVIVLESILLVSSFSNPAQADSQVGANDFRISDVGVDGDISSSAFDPAVAYNPAANQYLVVPAK